ncbi:MAG: hypothetical protein AAFS03_04040 [Pseudomonadota bacterium]
MAPLVWISVIALGLGAVYGAAALVSPSFAATSVRLQADPERPGGYAEFRATIGGVFFALHAYALFALLTGGASGPALTVAAGWIGAAIGRGTAIALDGNHAINPGYNAKLIGLELVFALAIAAPLLQA